MRIFICCLLIAVVITTTSYGQNVGIGTSQPQNKLQVQGSLLVTTPTTATTATPTIAQTKTMVIFSNVGFGAGDSTGRIYDPGGPAGNYAPNQIAESNIAAAAGTSGIELTIESIDLSSADSLIVRESAFGSTILAIGNLYSTPGKWIFNSVSLQIEFKSNSDANVGAGFSLLFRRLYTATATQAYVNSYAGSALFFDTKNGAFRSGQINNDTKGDFSAATGYNTQASGIASTALGAYTRASGDYSMATGFSTVASGDNSTALNYYAIASGAYSTAMGFGTIASGAASTAIGVSNTASGQRSLATGFHTTASGESSTAMGNYVNTNNYEGSFLIGDNSTTTVMNGTTPNNFRARFDGGYRFYTSSDYSTSCALSPGANAWSTTSDMRLKENFETINGEDFLKKIATMRLVSWNYKKQDPSKFRHYGPMAQDFYAAFGKDRYGNIGNDTTINQADFDGVNLIAIQALEKRTAEQKQENEELKNMLLQVRKELDELKKVKSCGCPCPQKSLTVNK